MSEKHRHDGPSSAGEGFEPYGLTVHLQPAPADFDPRSFLKSLLEEIARGCEAAGATLIGHIKCFLAAGDHGLYCNLVSTRTGACCGGDEQGALSCAHGCRLDLAVLVYGLPPASIDAIVRDALGRLLGATWS